MQQPLHTPPHAQHVPNGWTFPTLTESTPPSPRQAGPITGGGGASVTRVRWGRLLPVFAGLALVAFGLWSTSTGSTGTTSPTTASGGGGSAASEIEIARSARADAAAAAAEARDITDRAGPDATTPPASAPRAAGAARPAAARRAAGARGAVRRAAPAGAAMRLATPAAAATAMPRTVQGGGGPAGELPLTGIETWIAAILGILLLAGGIAVQVNAVRLAATALLYRRGILLRPVDCARVAQERGFPRARVALSNALHRLLQEPARGDFVATRMR